MFIKTYNPPPPPPPQKKKKKKLCSVVNTLRTMYLLIYTVAILSSFVLNSYYGMLQEKSGTTVFWFIVKYI